MIKIGRTMNAVMFASTIVIRNFEMKTFTEGRQYFRSYLILGGYLREAIKVVLAVKGRYVGDPQFEPLRLLALDAKHKKVRSYLKKVRNFAAFHLDEFDETTRRTLSHMKPTAMNIIGGDDASGFSVYYEIADFLDFAFLVEEVADGRPAEEVRRDLTMSILDFSRVHHRRQRIPTRSGREA